MLGNVEGEEFSSGYFLPAVLLVLFVRERIIQENILWHVKSLLSRVR